MLADYSNLGVNMCYKELTSWDVSEWDLVRIPEGAILGTNIVNDE